MNIQDEEKLPTWYYRSDDRPMEFLGRNQKWTLYEDSEVIEANYQEYIDRIDEKNENPYVIYESQSTYNIDFRENFQKDKKDHSKQRLVGRFLGDSNSENTLNYLNSILIVISNLY